MTNKTYDTLKWIAATAIPAVTTLWLAIAGIWGLPFAVPIGATLAAADLFLGTLLGITSVAYAKMQAPDVTKNTEP